MICPPEWNSDVSRLLLIETRFQFNSSGEQSTSGLLCSFVNNNRTKKETNYMIYMLQNSISQRVAHLVVWHHLESFSDQWIPWLSRMRSLHIIIHVSECLLSCMQQIISCWMPFYHQLLACDSYLDTILLFKERLPTSLLIIILNCNCIVSTLLPACKTANVEKVHPSMAFQFLYWLSVVITRTRVSFP